MDSGPQENWAGLVHRGRKKGSTALTQGSSRLSQPRARVLRGHRQEAMEDGESSPAESDSSDQGEAATTETCAVMGNKTGHSNLAQLSAKQCLLKIRKM